MEPTSSVTGLVTGYTHNIRDRVNCQSENLIYYWKCNKTNCDTYPNCEYIGKSCRSFQARISEHKYYAMSEKLEEPAGNHFNEGNHSVANLTGCVLESVRSQDKYVLSVRETMYIQKFDTFRNGLNKEP